MKAHPENSDQVNELVEGLGSMETVDVWCKGCKNFTIMNAAYAKILDGEISSCSRCRHRK
jgi:pyruvate/2-oxoacid:ferredoxin oxidoreductase beta subunit